MHLVSHWPLVCHQVFQITFWHNLSALMACVVSEYIALFVSAPSSPRPQVAIIVWPAPANMSKKWSLTPGSNSPDNWTTLSWTPNKRKSLSKLVFKPSVRNCVKHLNDGRGGNVPTVKPCPDRLRSTFPRTDGSQKNKWRKFVCFRTISLKESAIGLTKILFSCGHIYTFSLWGASLCSSQTLTCSMIVLFGAQFCVAQRSVMFQLPKKYFCPRD